MPRQTKRLTDLKVKRITASGLYADGDGLYLKVTGAGTKSYLYRYKTVAAMSAAGAPYWDRDTNAIRLSAGGKPKTVWMGLGAASVAPGDGRVTLADARAKAAELRHQRWLGNDPMAAKRAAKIAARLEAAKSITFKDCTSKYIAAHGASWRSEKHRQQWDNTLRDYAEPVLGNLPVGTIETAHVLRVLEPIWTTKTETATRIRGRIEQILDWARVHGYREGENPARWRGHLDKLLARPSKVMKHEHHAALAYDDMPAFMVKLRAEEGTAARALEFLILTVGRTGEVIGARKPEFDTDKAMWTVPTERMKAGREHRVPLSKAALALAEEAMQDDPEFLFPGRRAKTPISNMAMSMLMRRMGYEDFTVHGFRSTFRDWAAERTSYPREVAEMALAHIVSDETESAYFRSDMIEKRRRLAEEWSKWCSRPAKAAGHNVVSIGSKAAVAE
jgi:integrase